MYNPSSFQMNDPTLINEFIANYGFAVLIITQNNIPYIAEIPLVYDTDANSLKGHLAKVNPIVSTVDFNAPYNCVVLFQGPNAYISPSWYATKLDSGKVVPTWNFITVHMEGTARIITNEDWIMNVVTILTDKYEETVGSNWKVTDAPVSYTNALARAIVGIEIAITKVEGKFKLSQNKNEADIRGVITGLHNTGRLMDSELAQWMERMNEAGLS
jgi:transcriptional regulator